MVLFWEIDSLVKVEELRNAGVNLKLFVYEKLIFFVDVLMA